MEVSATLRFAHIAPQKARLVADQIRGLSAEQAVDVLTFNTRKAATLIKKVLDSAIANAENNEAADVDELKVAKVFVNEGPRARRFRARARGRANRIMKPTSHITVTVATDSN